MPDVLVRNISEAAIARLKVRAARNNRSLQQELQRIVTRAAGDDVVELVGVIRERRAEYAAGPGSFRDSAEAVRRDRER